MDYLSFSLGGAVLLAGWALVGLIGRYVPPASAIPAATVYIGIATFAASEANINEIPWALVLALVSILTVVPMTLRYPGRTIRGLVEQGVIAWIAFAGYMGLSLLWSDAGEYGRIEYQVFVAQGVIPGICAMILFRARKEDNWTPLLVAALVYPLVVVLGGVVTSGRLSLPNQNPIWIARSALIGAAVAILARRQPMVLRLAVAIGGTGVAVLTASRGPMLSFISAFALAAALNTRGVWGSTMHRVLRGTVVAAGVLVALMATMVGAPNSAGSNVTIVRRIQGVVNDDGSEVDQNVAARLDLLRRGVARVGLHPAFGSGLGTSIDARTGQYPHNLPLEVLIEGGIVGFALWMTALVLSLSRARQNSVLWAVLVISILYCLSSGDLRSNQLVAVFGIMALGMERQSSASRIRAGPARIDSRNSEPLNMSRV